MNDTELQKFIVMLDSNTKTQLKDNLSRDINLFDKLLPLVRERIGELNAECKDDLTKEYVEALNELNRLTKLAKQTLKQVDKLVEEEIELPKNTSSYAPSGKPHYVGEKFTDTRPLCIIFENHVTYVDTWGEVFKAVCDLLNEKYPTTFKFKAEGVVKFFDIKPIKRSSHPLKNENTFILTHYDANVTTTKIATLLNIFGIPRSSLEIYLK